MAHEQLDNLSPHEQQQYLHILLGTLAPELRAAVLEIAHWLAREYRGDEDVTSAQVLQWIEEVRVRNEQLRKAASAIILPFRRKA